MDSVQLMVKEHEYILRLNHAIQRACVGIVEGKEVCIDDFRKMIDFARNYADKHHHGKEEQILFKEMQQRLGAIGNNLITHGMLVEHDLGRLYMSELETALNEYEKSPSTETKLEILANAVGYAKLLKRHIDKENSVVYTYAEKNLPPDILTDVDTRTAAFEKQAEDTGTQKKYLDMLMELEQKYS